MVRRGKDHAHSSDGTAVAVHLLTNTMRKRAREELTSIPKIYEEERKKLLTGYGDATPQDIASKMSMFEYV